VVTRTAGSHHLTSAEGAWLAVSLMVGAGLGAIRAATVRIWRAQDEAAWHQNSPAS
jgi:hypothetical protein